MPLAEGPARARAQAALELLGVLQDELRVLEGLLLAAAQLLERGDQPVARVERLEAHPVRVACRGRRMQCMYNLSAFFSFRGLALSSLCNRMLAGIGGGLNYLNSNFSV